MWVSRLSENLILPSAKENHDMLTCGMSDKAQPSLAHPFNGQVDHHSGHHDPPYDHPLFNPLSVLRCGKNLKASKHLDSLLVHQSILSFDSCVQRYITIMRDIFECFI